MSGEAERAAAKVLTELGVVIALPARPVTVRPDGAGGVIVTLRPGASMGEIVSALSLCPPGMVWQLQALAEPDGGVSLMFARTGDT